MLHSNDRHMSTTAVSPPPIAFVLITFFAINLCGCSGHDNPFDPKAKDVPFKLQVEPFFGRVDLKWEPLELKDGKPFEFDFYKIYRKTQDQNWTLLADTTREIRYEDFDVHQDTVYTYKIDAWRGDEKSDFSDSLSQSPFWYPKHVAEIGNYDIFPNPTDIAICSLCNKRYVVNSDRHSLVILDQFDQKIGSAIPVGLTPVSVDFWHNSTTNQDTIVVCNNGGKSLFLVARDGKGTYAVFDTLQFATGFPASIRLDSSRKAYVSFDDIAWLFRIDLDNGNILDTLSTNGKLTRIEIADDSRTLLGLDKEQDQVIIVDLVSWTLKSPVAVEDTPVDIAILPDQDIAYVASRYFSGYQGDVKISVINFGNSSPVPEREIVLPLDGSQNFPVSVLFVPAGLGDGLLFINVWTTISSRNETRLFGYHVGPNTQEPISVNVITEARPILVRSIPDANEFKLYVLHDGGLHTFY